MYDAVPSSQCGQSDLFEDNAQLMQKLNMAHQHHASVQDATWSLHVETLNFTATHLPPQATTRSRLPMAQLCRSTVTWKYSLWRRGQLDEAHINMTDSSSQCPVGFLVETATKLRFCFREFETGSARCDSMLFDTFRL